MENMGYIPKLYDCTLEGNEFDFYEFEMEV